MSSPAAPPAAETDKENVQDATQTAENIPPDEAEEKDTATELTMDSEPKAVNTDTSSDQEDGLHDVDVEEGITEEKEPVMRRSVAPRSPSMLGRNPLPKGKPLWLWILLIMVVISVIGAITITAVSATRGGLSKVAMGFLIFFSIVIVCIVPIACYTRANFFAMGMVH